MDLTQRRRRSVFTRSYNHCIQQSEMELSLSGSYNVYCFTIFKLKSTWPTP